LAPLSDKMLAEIEQKNMSKESPILVRLFKAGIGARGLGSRTMPGRFEL